MSKDAPIRSACGHDSLCAPTCALYNDVTMHWKLTLEIYPPNCRKYTGIPCSVASNSYFLLLCSHDNHIRRDASVEIREPEGKLSDEYLNKKC